MEIKHHFYSLKTRAVHHKISPNNSKSLWDAVKIAKNNNCQQLPPKMFKNNAPINDSHLPDKFASFSKDKVEHIINEQSIQNGVHNGKKKVNSSDTNFMTLENVTRAIKLVKIKNSEGYDRIP